MVHAAFSGRGFLSARRPVLFDGLSLALLAGLTVLAFLTFQHYGVSFDEEVQDNYGKAIVEWYRTLGRDRAAVEYLDLYYYGGLFDTLAALFNQVSPFGHWESRHLLNALVGIVGLTGCWRFGRHLGGPAAGFLALALLALMPSYYGMMFINPKDVPFAVGMVWSAYFLTRIAERLPEAPRDELIKLTIAAGLTMGIRVGGFLVLFFLGITIFIHALGESRWDAVKLVRSGLRSTWRVFLPVFLGAWALMLLFWPWAQLDPLHHPFKALAHFSAMDSDIDTLFFGEEVGTDYRPLSYLPIYIAIKQPLVNLALLACALALVLWEATRRRIGWTKLVRYTPLALLFAFPPLYVLYKRPELYDAERHFLFVLPAVALLAGLAAAELARRGGKPGSAAIAAGVMAGVAWQVPTTMALHPYEYAYLNESVGGLRGAENQFETEYWGTALAEASHLLVTYVQDQHPAEPDRVWHVAICGNTLAGSYMFPSYMDVVDDWSHADFFVGITRHGCDKEMNGEEMFEISRSNVAFAVVKDVRPKAFHSVELDRSERRG